MKWYGTIMGGVAGLMLLSGCASTNPAVSITPVEPAQENQAKSELSLEKLSVDELLTQGNVNFQSGNIKIARLYYQKAFDKAPESAEALSGIGLTLFQAGDFEGASLAYGRAVEVNPDYLPALLGAGRTARNLGENTKALELFNHALMLGSADPETMTEMAITYDNTGQAVLAEELYLKVTQKLNNQPSAYNNLGFNYLLQHKYPQAISALSRAMDLDPGSERIKNNLAAAMILNGEEPRALNLFSNSVGKAAAYNNVGYIHMTNHQWDKAEHAFLKAIDTSPVYYERANRNLQKLRAAKDGSPPPPAE